MDSDELADPDLRATLLAAERAPAALRQRHARISALLGEGALILPYVMSASCSDPRDRRVPDTLTGYTRVEGIGRSRRRRRSRARQQATPRGSPRLLIAAVLVATAWIFLHFLLIFWAR